MSAILPAFLRPPEQPGEGGPGGFYHRLGFADTGEVDGGELVMHLPL